VQRKIKNLTTEAIEEHERNPRSKAHRRGAEKAEERRAELVGPESMRNLREKTRFQPTSWYEGKKKIIRVRQCGGKVFLAFRVSIVSVVASPPCSSATSVVAFGFLRVSAPPRCNWFSPCFLSVSVPPWWVLVLIFLCVLGDLCGKFSRFICAISADQRQNFRPC
jgi:hypothetical protein